MDRFLDNVAQWLQVTRPALDRIVWTLCVLAVCLGLQLIIRRVLDRRIKDIARKHIARKTVSYLLGLMAIIGLVRIWVGGIAGIATYLGIVSAGLAIALQDPVTNLAAWIYIVVRKPFVTGDRIQIGEHRGDVVDISLFQFSIVEIGNWVNADQSTGRIIHVPNGWVFKRATSNYTQGFNFVWNELPVTVTFESNWEKAKEILTRIATEHSAVKTEHAADQIRNAARKFMIFYEHLTPIVWTSVCDFGVTLTVRYLCEPRRRRSSAARIWEEILREFGRCDDVDFAYPTQRFYNNAAEGKPAPGAGAEPKG